MANRIYPVAVVLFWLSTMTWLVLTKVAPALRRGDPPDHHAVSVEKVEKEPPVIWDMKLDFREIGWAASWAQRLPDGGSEIRNRIQFTDVPRAKTGMSWFMSLVAQQAVGTGSFKMRIDNRSRLSGDGMLERIDSEVHLGGATQIPPWLRVEGRSDKRHLTLRFWLGSQELPTPSPVRMRRQSLIANDMSPRGYMPGLKLHQEWTTYQISPLRPTEIQKVITAKVEHYEPINWDKGLSESLVVVYREDAGAGSRTADQYVGKLWVRPTDGMVIKQEVTLLGARLTLVRRHEATARSLAEHLQSEWSATSESTGQIENHDTDGAKTTSANGGQDQS